MIDNQLYINLFDDLFKLSKQIADFIKYVENFETRYSNEV
jgi:hypothetical protein